MGATITPAQAIQALASMAAQPEHVHWGDSPEPLGLAALRGECLATLDRGLVSFASAGGLAGHAELVSARVTVQEPGAKYTAPRVKRGAR